MPRRWTDGALEMLHSQYGLMLNEHLATRIGNEFGWPLTGPALRKKADREGLTMRDCQGYLTMREAAREIGTDHKTVSRWMAKLEIRSIGKHPRARYLDPQDVERLRGAIGRPPVECLPVMQVVRLLGVCQATVMAMVDRGELRAHRAGKRWLVEAASIPRDSFGRPIKPKRKPRRAA